ncbi:hypothetical protein CPAR01_03404 [Colletotrichum paranaense]|uniref:Cell wall protein n=12 Tax=Colletotrichum acutatum species complex TaxID=2707335 RepID=A0A135T9W2_9PEZI|nr:uncharacterized protein HER10_EVM0006058 [Colletotrichum scovillei]XP_049140545.1 uncharacterized protein CLUP02_04389 [Colletotrichum lupini]XP_060308662.1 uncharacterized protein CCOS01_12465 [Colletotrichum costaricense]XP_060355019.1 uncharacterized protein CPAR01_03404 [Colletotrichum paranaense]XP_060359447.1 uncharacterized protein BDZ83DRAFT_757013 [Colletotrichum acutatum]XP_060377111.1 uncharacterized protein CTAM01_12203 [Colletotrichum tamarilloi]XP_060395183.1 uncharacterized 
MKAYAVVLSLATLAVAQMNGGAAPVPPPAPAAGDTPACAEAKILAGGIALNIEVQQQEVNGVNAVMQALQANPPNPQQFQTAKSNLLSFVSDGIQVRQANQLIAPSGNMATQGLAVVANAQLSELQKVAGLTGNPAQDMPVVQSLMMDFSGGIKKNMENQQMAVQGAC